MSSLTRRATTDMEVTSIRLERDLKERLKSLSGSQGYQALIREILWSYVNQCSHPPTLPMSGEDLRASFTAMAQRNEQCSITGKPIQAGEPMLLGLTTSGRLVSLSLDSVS
jgi:hypothetical protein